MPIPDPRHCGRPGEPACPPEPASGISASRRSEEPVLYTLTEMKEYGWDCYEKGKADHIGKKLLEEK